MNTSLLGRQLDNLDNILYIDTESENFICYSIQTHFKGKTKLFYPLKESNWIQIKRMWDKADAVLFFNAPYDMGVLSKAFKQNSAEWKTRKIYNTYAKSGFWDMSLFGYKYEVRKISTKFNLIKNKKSPPVIDLLKLWSIFIDDGRSGNKIGLKELLKRELNIDVIEWENRNTNLLKYLEQDIIHLRRLFNIFLNKVKDINEVKEWKYQEWADIKTNATITKYCYNKAYPLLKMYAKHNAETNSKYGLNGILEDAYMGGFTIALKRGWLKNKTVWYDIKSSYASVIENLNLDNYLQYDIEELKHIPSINRDEPYLCCVMSDVVLKKIDNNLRIFNLKTPIKLYLWSFDVLFIKCLFKDVNIKILKAYKPIPLLNVKSLPIIWKENKNKQVKDSVLYDYYKLLSNTAYGIKAQRRPFITSHTNMVIAGIITSRARLTLGEIIEEAEKHKFKWVYSDTDSVCLSYNKYKDITKEINDKIYPYSVGNEGYNYKTLILSLKRYLSYNGTGKDKIKLHGKGLTNISKQDLYNYIVLKQSLPKGVVSLYQLGANTQRSRLIMSNKLNIPINDIPPFAFIKNIKTNLTYTKWFNDWYYHMDNKMSKPIKVVLKDGEETETVREFLKFENIDEASLYISNFTKTDKTDNIDDNIGSWNEDLLLDYYFK